jgi:lipoic acid synthetase
MKSGMSDIKSSNLMKKPSWLKRRLPSGRQYEQTRALLRSGRLHTVCQEADCPNIFECFSKHTATFLILGDRCTRTCTFCAVQHHPEGEMDPDEPRRVADAAAEMDLTHVVVTSVTRDDLPDGGAAIFAETIDQLRRKIPKVTVEVLIPDFQGDADALAMVLAAAPDVLNHNIETVERLYPSVRPQAGYQQSLELLRRARQQAPNIPTKSGLMLGLGETDNEIEKTLKDLRQNDCQMITIGQYLQPSVNHHPVVRYVPPESFDRWRHVAEELGFASVASGPFVRSSYNAGKALGEL